MLLLRNLIFCPNRSKNEVASAVVLAKMLLSCFIHTSNSLCTQTVPKYTLVGHTLGQRGNCYCNFVRTFQSVNRVESFKGSSSFCSTRQEQLYGKSNSTERANYADTFIYFLNANFTFSCLKNLIFIFVQFFFRIAAHCSKRCYISLSLSLLYM